MSDFKKQYKKPSSIFGNVREIKQNLARELQEARKKHRARNIEESRKRKNLPCSTTATQEEEHKKKLLEWKAERERQKKAEKSQKKPPFKVGIVRHNIYSPTTSFSVVSRERKKITELSTKSSIPKKGITRATEKRLLAKKADAAKRKALATSIAKKEESSTTNKNKSDHGGRESFAPANHKFNPPAGLSGVSLYEEVSVQNNNSSPREDGTLASDKSTENLDTGARELGVYSDSIETVILRVSSNEQGTQNSFSPGERVSLTEQSMLNNDSAEETSRLRVSERSDALHTPIVATSRENCTKNLISVLERLTDGDDRAGREERNDSHPRRASLSDGLPSGDNEVKISNASTEEANTKHFKRLLSEERNRLQKLCEVWTEIQSQDDITEDARYRINQAVGQTSLLIKEKFQQFRNLALDCERGNASVLVTCMDLHGFWDMMYREVKDCDSRFAKLEQLRARHWQEEPPSFAESSTRSIVKKKQVEPTKRSLLQAFLPDKRNNSIATTQDNSKKDSQRNINLCNEFATPSTSGGRAADVLDQDVHATHGRRFFKKHRMYTSTPADNFVALKSSSRTSTPFITMKVNQLYKPIQLNGTLLYSPDRRTPRGDLLEKSGRIDLGTRREADMDGFISTKLSDGETLRSKKRSPKEVDSSNSSTVVNSVSTVIETTTSSEDEVTIILPHNIDLIETPVDNKSAKKRVLSVKKLRNRSILF